MIYGVKCPTCGLMQMPRPACKSCGAVLEIPSEAPPKTPSKVPSRVPPKARPKAFSEVPSEAPSEDRAPRRVVARTTGVTGTMGTQETIATPGTAGAAGPMGTMETMGAAGATGTTGISRCSECGLVFRGYELIRFGDTLVCGGCKPLYVQRLREGVTLKGETVYAGFWIRFSAKFIDGIILGIVGLTLGFLGGFVGGRGGAFFINFVSRAVGIVYVTYFLGKFGATPGKMVLDLKVIRADGEKISYARAFGRVFAEILSSIILCIGYIIAAFDEEKRALHDRICDTRVVRVVRA